MRRKPENVRYPNKSNSKKGKKNPAFKHGGYVPEPLTEEEQIWFDNKRKEYLDYYDHLNEPAMKDLLDEMLRCQLRIKRLTLYSARSDINNKDRDSALYALDRIVHTWRLLLTSLGMTRQSRGAPEKRKKRRVMPPAEVLRRISEETKNGT